MKLRRYDFVRHQIHRRVHFQRVRCQVCAGLTASGLHPADCPQLRPSCLQPSATARKFDESVDKALVDSLDALHGLLSVVFSGLPTAWVRPRTNRNGGRPLA